MAQKAPHQVHIDDVSESISQMEIAASAEDKKKLVLRVTPGFTTYAVHKDGIVQVFTNLAAAVKKYNS